MRLLVRLMLDAALAARESGAVISGLITQTDPAWTKRIVLSPRY